MTGQRTASAQLVVPTQRAASAPPAVPDRAGPATGIDIGALLPHRFPMLLVDRVLEIQPGDRIRVAKAITVNEPWYAGHGAGVGDLAYPRPLLLESWIQAAGVLAANDLVGAGDIGGAMLLGRVAHVVFHRDVYPGDVIEHTARLSRAIGPNMLVEGSSTVAGELVLTVAQAVLALRPPQPAEQEPRAAKEDRT